MKTPLRYAGGKSKAYNIITEYLPKKEDLPTGRIVSPFIGGGSLESRWSSELGIPVEGWDCFETLIVFWNILLQDPVDLANRCRYLVPTKEEYKEVKEELMKWTQTQTMFQGFEDYDEVYDDDGNIIDRIVYKDPLKYYKRKKEDQIDLDHRNAAAYYYFNHNLSYGPMYLGWMSKIYQDPIKWARMCDRIEQYRNPNLSVMKGPFELCFSNIDENDFLYLDPPYYLDKENSKDNKMFKGMYPNCNFAIHHNYFDHDELEDRLYNHKGNWILSYNNCEWVRETYKDYEQVFPKWHYSYALGETRVGKNKVNNDPKESHEILIIKR